MLYRVVKGAFGADFLTRVERFAARIPRQPAGVVEDADYSTRQAEVCWMKHGTPAFAFVERELFAVVKRERLIDPAVCALESLQYTVYHPGGFHDWHIDAYKRSYNVYDTALGKRFIGKKRTLSLSILLNDAGEFAGGGFEISMFPNGRNTIGTSLDDFTEAGDLAIFDSALCHRVAPMTRGERRSLVGWICA
jgi:predicted 2-oxoglutarate/Fe(II)-dependent dioxygenase YbiX